MLMQKYPVFALLALLLDKQQINIMAASSLSLNIARLKVKKKRKNFYTGLLAITVGKENTGLRAVTIIALSSVMSEKRIWMN